jgi:hypothetical protein
MGRSCGVVPSGNNSRYRTGYPLDRICSKCGKGTDVPEEEEEETQVEASLEELIAKKTDRPTVVEEDDDDESMLTLGRDEARESLNTKVLPIQQNEFVCRSCYLVKHRSQLADRRRELCRDCA